MKKKAWICTALILFVGTIGTYSYFNMLNAHQDRPVLAYKANAANVQMKLLSRGDALERKMQEVDLRLMTYNMHRGIGKDGKLNLKAIADIIISSDAKVVALQEVERYSIRTGFQDQIKNLSKETEMNYAFGKSTNILNGEYGNGLLSKYPIEEYKVFDLPSQGEQRTVLRTVINVEGLRLAIYNTHLGLQEAERKEQLDFILQMLSEETLDYILMGDLNSKIQQLKAITEKLKDCAQNLEQQQQSTFEENGVRGRIDYIFVAPSMESKSYDVIVSEASDHYPVISEVMIR